MFSFLVAYRYTAMLYWKSASPWPVFRGAMYDSWLNPTGGFHGAQAAIAAPGPPSSGNANGSPTQSAKWHLKVQFDLEKQVCD